MTLLDAIKIWLDSEPELKHFYVQHSDLEDFDSDWICCPCSDHILAIVEDRSVFTTTTTVDTSLDRVQLPLYSTIPAEHPQFFELIKSSLLKCHIKLNDDYINER